MGKGHWVERLHSRVRVEWVGVRWRVSGQSDQQESKPSQMTVEYCVDLRISAQIKTQKLPEAWGRLEKGLPWCLKHRTGTTAPWNLLLAFMGKGSKFLAQITWASTGPWHSGRILASPCAGSVCSFWPAS